MKFENLFNEFSKVKDSVLKNGISFRKFTAIHSNGNVNYVVFTSAKNKNYEESVKVYEEMDLIAFIDAARFQIPFFKCEHKWALVSKKEVFDGWRPSVDIQLYSSEEEAFSVLSEKSNNKLCVIAVHIYPEFISK